MSIRDERLTNDYRALQRLCAFNEPVKIKILEKRGEPPDYYRIQLSNCKGVESVSSNIPKYRTEHIIVISNFPSEYPDPGKLPNVTMETPIFHPNVFSHGGFCFKGGELEKLNQPLDALVKRVISMIQYEIRRFGVPANSNARDWANINQHLFPLSTDSTTSQSKPNLTWR
ncbi:hypothetical protein DSM106972_098540 [Dulcicalothrix desertica PCC 7102]|uniref:UBC core domain-containing protein n=1 Tax=Dulcicalothrix desertica PCC 7102 TaxID=232991 RepID=A0A3S1CHR5_9CYAN|nr:ubiquitin-conjugating enzyme E2 [Dulcicalothrix desertica]RUS92680.1 hypothetical protein DSM106972_098540 [Dulcicalothrix desertica PCC 7102]TWH61375.1 Ubiquitin-protein ligase [Dulcicalothrix desertica PCC 7102]